MQRVVTTEDTAIALGSGDVPVLATPRLIAWLEAETVRAAAAQLGPGQTSVGTSIRIEHRRATAVGGQITLSAAEPVRVKRRLTFAVRAIDEAGEIVADGEIDRVLLDRAEFIASTRPQ